MASTAPMQLSKEQRRRRLAPISRPGWRQRGRRSGQECGNFPMFHTQGYGDVLFQRQHIPPQLASGKPAVCQLPLMSSQSPMERPTQGSQDKVLPKQGRSLSRLLCAPLWNRVISPFFTDANCSRPLATWGAPIVLPSTQHPQTRHARNALGDGEPFLPPRAEADNWLECAKL